MRAFSAAISLLLLLAVVVVVAGLVVSTRLVVVADVGVSTSELVVVVVLVWECLRFKDDDDSTADVESFRVVEVEGWEVEALPLVEENADSIATCVATDD